MQSLFFNSVSGWNAGDTQSAYIAGADLTPYVVGATFEVTDAVGNVGTFTIEQIASLKDFGQQFIVRAHANVPDSMKGPLSTFGIVAAVAPVLSLAPLMMAQSLPPVSSLTSTPTPQQIAMQPSGTRRGGLVLVLLVLAAIAIGV